MSDSDTVQVETLSSVTLTRNAKGHVQPEVKVRNADPDKAKEDAIRIFDELDKKYPTHGM